MFKSQILNLNFLWWTPLVTTCGEVNVEITIILVVFIQDLHLSEWQLVAVVVSIADDDYDDDYLKVQVDVLPAAMQEQEYRKATDVSEHIVLYYILVSFCELKLLRKVPELNSCNL